MSLNTCEVQPFIHLDWLKETEDEKVKNERARRKVQATQKNYTIFP